MAAVIQHYCSSVSRIGNWLKKNFTHLNKRKSKSYMSGNLGGLGGDLGG